MVNWLNASSPLAQERHGQRGVGDDADNHTSEENHQHGNRTLKKKFDHKQEELNVNSFYRSLRFITYQTEIRQGFVLFTIFYSNGVNLTRKGFI